uniref:Uncharacterized protein n=1 Tax=Wuchereria bancrofti TaxID=6293 RepID=A0AAF5PHH5_WUCBA
MSYLHPETGKRIDNLRAISSVAASNYKVMNLQKDQKSTLVSSNCNIAIYSNISKLRKSPSSTSPRFENGNEIYRLLSGKTDT